MNPSPVTHTPVQRVYSDHAEALQDLVVTEEPLEIRIGFGPETDRQEKRIAVTMRTPGHDHELAVGFLFSEGIIRTKNDILSVRHCQTVKSEEERGNVIRVEIHPETEINLSNADRNFYMTSSCGVCGKSSLEAIEVHCPVPILPERPEIPTDLILGLPDKLNEHQVNFTYTGGLHAAGLFDREGNLICIREDVGRHNALDKITGTGLMEGLIPFHNHIILLSGRVGFEMVQKSVMTGTGILAAIGAPSSLAIELARKYHLTLIGFLRKNRFNMYS